MHRRHGQVLIALATLATFTLPAAAADCPDGEGKAKCLLSAANAAKDANPHEAAALYLASYRVETKIDALAGYGAALAADKQYVAASEALEKAIEDYQDVAKKMQDGNAEASSIFAIVHRIEFVQDQLKQMGLKTAKAKLKGDKLPPNVQSVIRKGGDDLRPRNQMQLIVNPGGDTLVFTFTDGKTVEKPVNMSPGTMSMVDIPDEPKPEVVVHEKEKPIPVESTAGSGQKLAAYVTGGFGVVLVGVGILYGSGSTASIGGTAAIVGAGGAGIGAGVILWFWGKSLHDAASPPQTAVIPMIGDGVVGALVSGRF